MRLNGFYAKQCRSPESFAKRRKKRLQSQTHRIVPSQERKAAAHEVEEFVEQLQAFRGLFPTPIVGGQNRVL